MKKNKLLLFLSTFLLTGCTSVFSANVEEFTSMVLYKPIDTYEKYNIEKKEDFLVDRVFVKDRTFVTLYVESENQIKKSDETIDGLTETSDVVESVESETNNEITDESTVEDAIYVLKTYELGKYSILFDNELQPGLYCEIKTVGENKTNTEECTKEFAKTIVLPSNATFNDNIKGE